MIGPAPVYTSQQLNLSTYLVIHNDKYLEFPFIYVKLYEDIKLAVVVDTGCGKNYGKGGRGPAELKDFIAQKIIDKHAGRDATKSFSRLRQASGYDFMVICTHCHFDHIGGIEIFASSGATIMASDHEMDFTNPNNLAANSLCEAFSMQTPKYNVTQHLADGKHITWKGYDLVLQATHTPGHTPDSLSIYDSRERWLFTGNTYYRRLARLPWGEEQDVPIVFPSQGELEHWKSSIDRLRSFVSGTEVNDEGSLRVGCGHTTPGAPATEILDSVKAFSSRVEAGEVSVVARLRGDQMAPVGSLADEIFVF
ncbi:hypothetical protein LTR86_010374 [Recurvomyces mirabilis]|nr:hypothetical protein LTR86_010374 [Recurvomyces mirabilis]